MYNVNNWLEASHSAPRIIYRADHSGRAITEHIVRAALKHPLIHVVTDTVVTDLILSNNACIGATVFDKLSKTHSSMFSSVGVTLASGGLAGIYTHSTNPPGFNALGSSTALAVRANVSVADLEFVQFHPTALCIPGEPCFLLTEALRGEGAKLVTVDGHAFAKRFHPMGELAPRDIVARGVYAQSQLSGRVYLDITHREAQWLRQRFPSIQEKVLQYGLDITKDKLPITPAAHYTCGGIVSDSNGCTSVQNLYVAGEAARTGLHGGNRLASTSLLEAIVWGSRYGKDFFLDTLLILNTPSNFAYFSPSTSSFTLSTAEFIGGNEQSKSVQDWARHEIHNFVTDHCEATARVNATNAEEGSLGLLSSKNRASKREDEERASTLLRQLKSVMWDNVGVVRSKSGLEEACSTILDIQKEAEELYYQQHRLTTTLESIMIRDASYAGLAVATSAIQNSQSRGSHYLAEESCETDDEQQVAASL
jgi:L-aspartate oxidase